MTLLSCIGHGPNFFLPLSEDFRERYEFQPIVYYSARQAAAAIAQIEENLAACDVLIYHHPDWVHYGEHHDAYVSFADAIPSHVQKISFPMPMLHAVWPFHTTDKRNQQIERSPTRYGNAGTRELVAAYILGAHERLDPIWNNMAFYPYGDSYVLDLLTRGLPAEEVISSYLTLDLPNTVDLDKIHSYTIASAARNEQSGDVKIADFIGSNFRSRKIMQSVNHASNRLLLYMANQVLSVLGCATVADSILERTQELVEPEMPIHPSIARYFDMSYITAETRYAVDRLRFLTFAEYVREYVYFL